MGRLIYFTVVSLDGFVEDAEGSFQWGAPAPDVFEYATELQRSIGISLYGRRMFEVMLFWEGVPTGSDANEPAHAFARAWRATEKIVFSRTLMSPSSSNTRLESEFTPGLVRQLKATSQRDLSVSGAELAGQALLAGLVDEVQLLVVPKLVGGGKPWFPSLARIDLELKETRQFASGFVLLRYRPRAPVKS